MRLRWIGAIAVLALGIALGVVLLTSGGGKRQGPPRASHGTVGLAPGRAYLFSDSRFATLVRSAGMIYYRVGAAWDQFGTWDGTGCVRASQLGQGAIDALNEVRAAESWGKTPIIVLGPDVWGATADTSWPAGALTPVLPNDQAMQCGVIAVLDALAFKGLWHPSIRLEPWNEPDWDYVGQVSITAETAASYFADAVIGARRERRQPVLLAGTFKNAPTESTTGNCPGHPVWTNQPGFAVAYICSLRRSGKRMPNGGQLRSYALLARSWSFHDYDDIVHSPNCAPGGSCNHAELTNFWNFLWTWHMPTDIWITESGDPSAWGQPHSRWEEAHEAYAWQSLRYSVPGVHLLWYQWGTFGGDAWDSALVDASGKPRPSYCVVAFGETPDQALADGRCPGT